jgi:hypothetical protein
MIAIFMQHESQQHGNNHGIHAKDLMYSHVIGFNGTPRLRIFENQTNQDHNYFETESKDKIIIDQAFLSLLKWNERILWKKVRKKYKPPIPINLSSKLIYFDGSAYQISKLAEELEDDGDPPDEMKEEALAEDIIAADPIGIAQSFPPVSI